MATVNEFQIRAITVGEARAVRWPVLRAGLPVEAAIFDGDEDANACHLGAFAVEKLVGVVSIFPRGFPDRPGMRNCWQLRGMAVVAEARNQGAGDALLKAVVAEVKRADGECLWCNARVPAMRFYEKHGWKILGEQFDIPTAGPHLRMWLPISKRKAMETPPTEH